MFSQQSKTITGAAVLLGIMSLVSRLIGVMRDRLFAHYFGAGDILDAYYAAFRIPDFIYNLIVVGAISAGFIPVFMALKEKNASDAWKFGNIVLTLFLLLLGIMSIILFAIAPWLMPYVVPGMNVDVQQMAILLTRIMLLSPILLGISSIFGGMLQSYKMFFVYSLTPIVYNGGIMLGAAVLYPRIGIAGLGYGVILGACAHMLIQIPPLVSLGYRINIHARCTKEVKQVFRLMAPRTIGLASQQLTLVLLTSIASLIGVGSITVFNFANNLQYFPIGVIGISYAVAAFPTFSELIAKRDKHAFVDSVLGTMRQVMFFILPLTVVFLLLRAQIVRVVLGSGAFDWQDTIDTANTLAFFSLSLFAQSLLPVITRAFYALQNAIIPMWSGIIQLIATVVLGMYLKDQMGIIGLALAVSIGSAVQLAFLWLLLRKKIGSLNEATLIPFLAKLSVSTIAMAFVTQMLKVPAASIFGTDTFIGIFSQGFIAGGAGLLVYFGLCAWLRIPEIYLLAHSVGRRWLKLRSVFISTNDTHN